MVDRHDGQEWWIDAVITASSKERCKSVII